MSIQNLSIIGSTEYVEIEGIKHIPAKIDTGADSSSVHVENIEMSPDGVLSFELFGKKLETTSYEVAVVRSSNGAEQLRYRTKLHIKLGKKRLFTTFSLSNRSKNNFPVLIGRATLEGRFLVNVSKRDINPEKNPKTKDYNNKLKENPFEFHQKYVTLAKEK